MPRHCITYGDQENDTKGWCNRMIEVIVKCIANKGEGQQVNET